MDCEFLVDNRLCKAIESAEGKSTRENSCANKSKNSCCYLCNNQDLCAISCNYLAKPKDMSEFNKSIEQKIKDCRAKIENLSLLFADGKIEEQSYADSVKTIARKIDDLNKSKSNPLTSPHIYSPDEFAEHAQKPTASARELDKTDDSISRLASQTGNIGYYGGLTFGIGYCLTIVGAIAVVAELVLRFSSSFSRYMPSGLSSNIPPALVASLIVLFISVICAIIFGLSVIRNSKSARDSGLRIDAISSSINAFSFMLFFLWIGVTILSASLRLSLFSPICGVVGSVLLFAGFKAYRNEASESKLIGAILMLISVALTYFVAFKGSGLSLLGVGPLFSEFTLEALALFIALIGAVIFAFPIVGEHRQSVASIILSTSVILFSCGIMYSNFSSLSSLNNLLSLAGAIVNWIPGLSGLQLNSIYILFFGFLLLGISGIITLIAACLPLVTSFKELSAKPGSTSQKTSETMAPVQPPPARVEARNETARPPETKEKRFCRYCGAENKTDATFCEKCGKKIS